MIINVSRPAPPPAEIELRRVRLALKQPFVTAHGTEYEREVVLVRLERTDGAVGWGECPTLTHPTYTGEYTAGAWAVLRDELVPQCLGRNDVAVVGHPMALGALHDAGVDAAARALGLALSRGPMHGEPSPGSVPTTAVIGVMPSIDDVLAAVAASIDVGHGLVKLKISAHSQDHEPLRAVRSTWPDLALAADANGSYGDVEDVLELDDYGLTYLEQPLPAEDLVGSGRLGARLSTPIALDEAVTSRSTFTTALQLKSLRVLNLKPARVGGLIKARSLADTAAEAGIDCFVGGMLETGIGRAAALTVAAHPGCTLPTDLGPSSRYFEHDIITQPFELNADGTLTVPTGPGIGVFPDRDRLEAATVDRVVLRR